MLKGRIYDRIPNRFPDERENSWLSPMKCAVAIGRERRERVAPHWQDEGFLLINTLAEKWQELVRIEALEAEVKLIKERFAALEQLAPILVPIQSFAPEPYDVVKPLSVVVRIEEDQYIATFFDANISASGDTHVEAVLNLKDLVVTMFEMLNEMSDKQLGPEPLRQKQLLREFIRMKA